MAEKNNNMSFSFSDAEMPVRFGRYMLLRRKSLESIGEHFLALWGVDEGIDQLRMVRAIYRSVAEDEDFVAMFTEEARSLSQLSSSNVVRIVEVGSESGIPFVAQEHVEGITLERLLQISEERGIRCHWELAAHVAAEMLRGLDHVHRREDVRGIPLAMRHGDIRPPNVLISFNGEVKLTNFSSSLYYMVHKGTNTRFETERGMYASPEGRRSASKGATAAGDLWGVSVSLLVMLEGLSALKQINSFVADGESLTSVAYRIREIPKRLNLLLARALHIDPRHRFDTASAMRDALLEILKENGVGHPPDDLSAFVKDLGSQEREEEEKIVRTMLGREASMSLDELSDSSKIAPGTVLDGKYHLLRLIGEGGMGQVFEAEHLGIEKRLAVKVLHERVLHDQVAVERFRREARILGGLGHPNIVSVTDYGVTVEGNYYLAMELLDGKSLGSKLEKNEAISPVEIMDIMIAVCNGLTAAHAAGVVHRDLKPDNIFLTRTGPRIVDFGIAKRTDFDDEERSLTKTGNICGTVEYISPEHIGGQNTDHRVDIYTAGLIIYEVLTGTTPFKGRNIAETMNRIMTDKITAPRKRTGNKLIPKPLEDICLKAMSRDPAKRYQSAEEMRLALEAVRAEVFQMTMIESLGNSKKTKTLHTVALLGLSGAMLLSAILIYFFKLNSVNENKVSVTLPLSSEIKKAEPLPSIHDNDDSHVEEKLTKSENNIAENTTEDTASFFNSVNEGEITLEELLSQGEAALKRLDLAGAAYHFKMASERDPRNPRGWYGQGRVWFERNDPQRAVIMIQKALKLDPGRYKWRVFLGKIYMSIGDRERAVREWKRVLLTRPNHSETLQLLSASGAPSD